MEATLGLTRPFSYGRGWPQLIRLPNPAAGAAAVHVVPGKYVERLVSAVLELEPSAQEATRLPMLRLLDPDARLMAEFGPPVPIVAGRKGVFTWAPGINDWAVEQSPQIVEIAKPAKGAIAEFVVPADSVVQLKLVRATLKTSAQEATRFLRLLIVNANGVTAANFGAAAETVKEKEQNTTWAAQLGFRNGPFGGDGLVSLPPLTLLPGTKVQIGAQALQTEDQIENVSLQLVRMPVVTHAQTPIPDMLLTAGMQLSLGASNIQTEDQVANPAIYVERWPAGPDGYPQGVERTFLPPGVFA